MTASTSKLAGKVALITGAGSGIGEATAILFAREGCRIGAVGRTLKELSQVCAGIKEAGGECLLLEADVSDPEAVKKAVEKLAQEFGRIDIVFANAGINGVWAPLEELTPEDWDKTLDVNLKGTFLTVKYAVPHLKKQGGSVLVNSSVNGTRMFSNTGATAYSCSKAGQVAFVKMTALELAKHRIRVNVICPGAIDTSISQNTEKREIEREKEPVEFPKGSIPLTRGKPGTSEQVARVALFLACDDSSHVTGTEIWVDGGESLMEG